MYFKYRTSTVKASVYFKHPSGQPNRFIGPAEYDVDEREYFRLERAFHAFEQHRSMEKHFMLRLINHEEVDIDFDKIWGILHESREVVLNSQG